MGPSGAAKCARRQPDKRTERTSGGMTQVNLGIVGLGRWAKVLTRAAKASDRFRIVAGYSRAAERRDAFAREFGVPPVPDLDTMLADPRIQGVILTVPN